MDIRIPKLGVAMTEGVLVQWLVSDGELVSIGTPLYLIETDKVENEVDSPASGTVRLVGEAGCTYPVGTIVATVD